MSIPIGLCQCGCGQETAITQHSGRGYRKGDRLRYVHGHTRNSGDRSRYLTGRGADGRRTGQHIRIAEQVFGGLLPPGAEVHHVNGNKKDNRNTNLVICQDRAYHMLLEQRTRALDACGHADWRLCTICKQYDDPANLAIYPKRQGSADVMHRKCAADRARRRRAAA